MQTEDSTPTANRDGILRWCAFALLIMVAHVVLVGVNWLLGIGLTIPLLSPGMLINALLDLPKPRNGYTPAVIGASAAFYGALAVLYCLRPRLAVVIGCAAVVGGVAAVLGYAVRALGGP